MFLGGLCPQLLLLISDGWCVLTLLKLGDSRGLILHGENGLLGLICEFNLHYFIWGLEVIQVNRR